MVSCTSLFSRKLIGLIFPNDFFLFATIDIGVNSYIDVLINLFRVIAKEVVELRLGRYRINGALKGLYLVQRKGSQYDTQKCCREGCKGDRLLTR